jgi:hypothetical protein
MHRIRERESLRDIRRTRQAIRRASRIDRFFALNVASGRQRPCALWIKASLYGHRRDPVPHAR